MAGNHTCLWNNLLQSHVTSHFIKVDTNNFPQNRALACSYKIKISNFGNVWSIFAVHYITAQKIYIFERGYTILYNPYK